jgi:hypothetical protein
VDRIDNFRPEDAEDLQNREMGLLKNEAKRGIPRWLSDFENNHTTPMKQRATPEEDLSHVESKIQRPFPNSANKPHMAQFNSSNISQ